MEDHKTGSHDAPEPESQAPGTEPGVGPEPHGEVALPDVKAIIATCVNLLAGRAWEAMGLVADSTTRKIERKLDDAQLAIDATAALADLLRPRLSDAERREVEVLVTNLRLNFVEQKSKQP